MQQRIARALFETRIGDRLLAWLERWIGLGIVLIDQIEGTTEKEPMPACD